jgi:hypothetical protein
VEIKGARHRELPVIMTGTAASLFQLPLQPVQITSHNIQEDDSTFPICVGKNKELQYKDGKRRRDGMEEARQHGNAQLYCRRTNSSYESQ